MEIRYYLNPVKKQETKSIQDPAVKAKLEAARPAQPSVELRPVNNYDDLGDDPVSLDGIPF